MHYFQRKLSDAMLTVDAKKLTCLSHAQICHESVARHRRTVPYTPPAHSCASCTDLWVVPCVRLFWVDGGTIAIAHEGAETAAFRPPLKEQDWNES